MKSDVDVKELVKRAQSGNQEALEAILVLVKDKVYRLAIRVLWHPADAEDATQEILMKIAGSLGSFRHESAFSTWVYSIASNHLLTTRKRRAELEEITFEKFEQQLNHKPADRLQVSAGEVEQDLLVEEVKIGCMQGMLLCLDRVHRIAYILGEIFEIDSNEGALILDVTPATFRKRLSRARERIRDFMTKNCGLIDAKNDCRCETRVNAAIRNGRMNPNHLLFAEAPAVNRPRTVLYRRIKQMDKLERAAALFRTHPEYLAPDEVVENIRRLVQSKGFNAVTS